MDNWRERVLKGTYRTHPKHYPDYEHWLSAENELKHAAYHLKFFNLNQLEYLKWAIEEEINCQFKD